MACKLIKNSLGEITGVTEQNDLFQQILNSPHVPNAEKALEVFLEVYSGEVGVEMLQEAKVIEYLNRINTIKTADPDNYWSVDVPSIDVVYDAVKNDRLVETKGGMAIVTEDGDMIGLFKDIPNEKGVAKVLQDMRVKKGGYKMDNFDTYLTKIYQKNGFKVVSRMPFNEDFAPDGWDKSKHGTPDVVFMIYDPNNTINFKERVFNKNQYEEAKQYRDSFSEEAKKNIPFYKGKEFINNTGKTQAFFTAVVEGNTDKYKSKGKWKPLLSFTTYQGIFKSIYDKFKGNFDDHIATSIPTFRETQIKVGNSILNLFSKTGRTINSDLEAVKNKYKEDKGIIAQPIYSKVDSEFFKDLANYHSKVKDDRQNPEMKKSYDAFLNETMEQYQYLIDAGYTIEPWMGEGEPYGVDSNTLREDIIKNKHLYYLRSRSATGEADENETAENYAPFRSTGIVLNGDDVLFNDLFRAVHNIFGHGMVANTFSTQGEFDAYNTHSPMYSKEAQKALFLETVVYNAYYSQNKQYAPRKIYDIPSEFLNYSNKLVYDIGGSEGGLVKAITEASNGKIESINLDVNEAMGKFHNATLVEGSEFVNEAFYENYTDEETGKTYKKHVPKKKADVVHESMVFQFITPERKQFIKEVKDNYLKDDGILLLEEKLVPETQEEWIRNEEIKDEYKRQFYTQEEISQKSEQILTGMLKNQTKVADLEEALRESFSFVQQYWDAGNFKGFIASNSQEKIDTFIDGIGGVITSEYSQEAYSIKKETSLSYKTPDGSVYTNYKDALKTTQIGDIQAGVNTLEGFKPLFSVSSDTSLSSYNGVINNLIKSGLLSGESYVENGKKVFKTEGNSTEKKAINAEQTLMTLTSYRGLKSSKVLRNGDIIIEHKPSSKEVQLTTLSGENQVVSKEELDKMSYSQLKEKYEDPLGIIFEREQREETKIKNTNIEEDFTVEFIPENTLQEKLMTFLKKMGIKTMDMETFIANYKTKNGVHPSASALASIANEVIAFKDGIVTTEDLSEETAHFIVAATPLVEKENLLRNIHKTKEWMEFSDLYRKVYNGNEELVREEILGKVLANALQSRFSAENQQTETGKNIVQRLRDLFNSFFNKVASYFQNSFYTELETYTQQVYNNLMAETLSIDKENLKDSNFNMFSIASIGKRSPVRNIYDDTTRLLDLLQTQENRLHQRNTANKDFIREARDIASTRDAVLMDRAFSLVALVAEKQVAHLERTVDKGFSHTEHAVYNTFKNFTEELIKSVKERLSNENPAHAAVKKSLESTLSRLATVEGKNSSKTNIDLDIMIERVVQKHGLTEKEAEEYKSLFVTKQKDTSWVYANFGSLVQARDPLLGLAGDVINKTQYEARVPFLQKAKEFLNKVGEGKDISKIIDNGFIVNEVDNKALSEYDLKIKTDLFNSITGRNVTTSEFKKLEREGLELTAEQRKDFNKRYREKTNEYKEAFFTQEFLDRQEAIFKSIPDIAVEFHKRDRAVRSDIRAEARDEDGVIVFDSNQISELQDLDKARFEAMSPVDVNGELKQGLVETYNTQTKEFELALEDESTASDEAKLAYGLYMINKNTREQFKNSENKEGIPQLFFDKLSMASNMLDFIFNNAYVGFSDSYWESLGDLESIYSKLLNSGNEGLAESIRQQQRIINSIHRKNRKLNRPSEVDYGRMSLGEKQAVRRAQEALEDLFREAKKVLPEEEQNIDKTLSDRVTNESYREELQDLGINNNIDELRFIKDHVTSNNLKAIQKMQDIAKGVSDGSITEVSGTYAEYVNPEMSSQEIEEALMRFARERLLPYFKRTEPLGFTELLDKAKNGGIQEIQDFINSDLVSIKPNFSFYETQVNENINPKYLENKAAGRLQIKEGFFESKKFKDLFGTVTTDSNGVRRPQKNQNLWDLREALLDLQKTTLTNYGEVNRQNIYKIPQIGKRGLRQWEDLIKKKDRKTAVEMIKDFTEFREDEAEFGQAMGVIPKYYLRDLENQEDVTDQYLYSYMLMLQQSYLYKARVENIGDMLAIETALLNPDSVAGKEAKASNTFKMFRSFMDYNFYGVKETFSYTVDIAGKKFDIAALARRFHRWIQLVNLSGLIVPLTSMLTGSVTKRIESVIGEVINPIAEAEANKRFRKMATGAAGEMLAINSKADLNVMMEYIGQYDLTNGRFENSNYSKMTRGATKWAEFTHSMANFPINPRVALSVWCDYRYVDGQIINYNQFKRRGGDKAKWKTYKLFINDTFVKDGTVQFNYKSIADNLGFNYDISTEDVVIFTKNAMEKITNATATAIQKIDTQIPQHEKSAAARHGIAAFFLMHSNWLILSATHKFKSRQWNNNTGQYEEGNWMTASRVLKEIAFGFKKGNGVSFFEHVKKTWTEGDETTKRNLNRVLVEMGFANMMLVLSYLLTQALDDDDDDLWAMQFANYMLYRVTNEQISQTVALPRQFTEAIDQPIKGVNRFYDLKDVTDVFNGDLVQNSPQYKDLSYRQRWLFRNIPALKDYNRLVRVDREMRSQKLFNKDNEAWTIFAYNIFKEDKDK